MISPPPASPLHIVIDIETLGTEPGCEIRSIGACAFHDTNHLDAHTFYRLTHNDINFYGHVDANALNWWRTDKRISKLARRHCLQHLNRADITRALLDFVEWIYVIHTFYPNAGTPIYWGNGPDFDQACLAVAMKACGVPIPWTYRDNRDYRTLMDAVGLVELRRRTVRHHSMHDAVHEARKIMLAIRALTILTGSTPFQTPSRRTRGGGTKQENT